MESQNLTVVSVDVSGAPRVDVIPWLQTLLPDPKFTDCQVQQSHPSFKQKQIETTTKKRKFDPKTTTK